jgi:CelD/BcsL family acetyltransferase involved in cellulose biosynthesis
MTQATVGVLPGVANLNDLALREITGGRRVCGQGVTKFLCACAGMRQSCRAGIEALTPMSPASGWSGVGPVHNLAIDTSPVTSSGGQSRDLHQAWSAEAPVDGSPMVTPEQRQRERMAPQPLAGSKVTGAQLRYQASAHMAWYDLNALSQEFLTHWRTLGLTASTPNIYLMPEFVLPAVRNLATRESPRLAALWNDDRSCLMALGIFNAVAPTGRFPYARLSTFRSIHSYQSGILIKAGVDETVVDRFLGGVVASPWRAVHIIDMREDALVHRQLQDAARRLGLTWFVDRRYERAGVRLDDESRWRDHISRSRHKRLQRARAKLAELGTVEFRIVQGPEVTDHTIEDFLRVEAMGWKRESGLLATEAGARFFREVVQGCKEQAMVFFCELLVDGKVIASSSNFQINGVGFAFKIGIDPDFLKFAPGFLLEYTFLQSALRPLHHLHEMESGAQPGSYIEKLWPERIPMVSGRFVTGGLPTLWELIRQRIRLIRRPVQTLVQLTRGAIGLRA